MNAPLFFTQVMRIYEVYDRNSRVVMGRVEVAVRDDLLTAAPWAMDYVKDGTEATGSRTGVRFIGERIIRKAEKPATFTDKQSASLNRWYKGFTDKQSASLNRWYKGLTR